MEERGERAIRGKDANVEGGLTGNQVGARSGGNLRSNQSELSIRLSGSRNHSSKSYRNTPEYEWNGWRKVYRGRKVRGPTIKANNQWTTPLLDKGPFHYQGRQHRPEGGSLPTNCPSNPSSSRIWPPISKPAARRAAKAASVLPGLTRENMD